MPTGGVEGRDSSDVGPLPDRALGDAQEFRRLAERQPIVLAGGSSLISGLPEALAKALEDLGGGRATVVKDPVFAGSDGSLAIARDASSSDWDKLSL